MSVTVNTDLAAKSESILEVVDVCKEFPLEQGLLQRALGRGRKVVALDHVDLTVSQGEILGLVGESGSGKSTLGYVMVRLLAVTSGRIRYRGQDITRLERGELRPFRERVQMVFQDTQSSLNPRKTVGQALVDPLRVHGVSPRERMGHAVGLLEQVGLGPHFMVRYPHELSGGQRQRIGIARALAMHPEFLIADEPVSSLDVSLQAQILNLLLKLREDLGLTMVFVSHDLAIINRISSRVAVMYAGKIVEVGRPSEVIRTPAHPYTQALRASVPAGLEGRHKAKEPLAGDPPDPTNLPQGCRFVSRCPEAMAICREVYPRAIVLSETHAAECHLLTGASAEPRASSHTAERIPLTTTERSRQ